MSDRERLVEIIGGVQWNAKAEQVADALLKAGVTLPPEPKPRPVWPGLEGGGLAESWQLKAETYHAARDAGESIEHANRVSLSAVTAHLFRALVAGLPGNPESVHLMGPNERPCAVLRSALAALADPYDGGGK